MNYLDYFTVLVFFKRQLTTARAYQFLIETLINRKFKRL